MIRINERFVLKTLFVNYFIKFISDSGYDAKISCAAEIIIRDAAVPYPDFWHHGAIVKSGVQAVFMRRLYPGVIA